MPCHTGCPLGIDITSFIRLLREGDVNSALAVIHQENPFPALCGRVCTAPCESACIFYDEGHPITIRDLERYAADHGVIKNIKRPVVPLGKKIAIIGAGPAGLMLAYQLASSGIDVSVFDASQDQGGLLRYGIPEFMLPQKTVDSVINHVKAEGVNFVPHMLFGRNITLAELLMRGFNAVVLAVGSSVPNFDGIDGQSYAGVYHNVEFLNRAQTITKSSALEQGQKMLGGTHTVVIAKTIDAFDGARLARRLGQEVTVCWIGEEDKLSKAAQRINHALEEGIVLKEGVKITRINANENGAVQSVALQDIVENTAFELEAQTVILANGLKPNQFIRQHLPQLQFNDDGTLWIDGNTGMTSVEKVFACGNIVIGPQAMVHAMAHAKKTAGLIKNYLKV